jgi:hypothetical protein
VVKGFSKTAVGRPSTKLLLSAVKAPPVIITTRGSMRGNVVEMVR